MGWIGFGSSVVDLHVLSQIARITTLVGVIDEK